ncbi:hydrolase 1, exosortase A system-associated [Massilia endophytica]|uniref:hydrolase 1, exosortase A system-associated n=1 Tax=Massilia endophytica TaxID=2899220 RepID=UPI001E63FB8F|nr:hydrolase 1, exosortase A system-associated [Massilia endophytica]UGQ46225.1 hydrolase 1, exosortase A system-associated [Massilia endophytica]
MRENALSFRCGDDWLTGIVSAPASPAQRGVLIVVGGPQYRAGSHRQFTLLARALAKGGIPAMRFDYRGMGDSTGKVRSFEAVTADLRAAIDQFMDVQPGLQEVVLWGLCDGASASLFHAQHDARVRGLVLLNPWVRTGQGLARVTIKHYYRSRLFDPELWRKIVGGQFRPAAALKSFTGIAFAASVAQDQDLPTRMLQCFAGFHGPVLLILSGQDLTAREFQDMVDRSTAWQRQIVSPRVRRELLEDANHTFSSAAWRSQVASWTADWVRSW